MKSPFLVVSTTSIRVALSVFLVDQSRWRCCSQVTVVCVVVVVGLFLLRPYSQSHAGASSRIVCVCVRRLSSSLFIPPLLFVSSFLPSPHFRSFVAANTQTDTHTEQNRAVDGTSGPHDHRSVECERRNRERRRHLSFLALLSHEIVDKRRFFPFFLKTRASKTRSTGNTLLFFALGIVHGNLKKTWSIFSLLCTVSMSKGKRNIKLAVDGTRGRSGQTDSTVATCWPANQ